MCHTLRRPGAKPNGVGGVYLTCSCIEGCATTMLLLVTPMSGGRSWRWTAFGGDRNGGDAIIVAGDEKEEDCGEPTACIVARAWVSGFCGLPVEHSSEAALASVRSACTSGTDARVASATSAWT